MDDGYDTCPRCKWAGQLRKDGTMRKHREAVDAGRIGSTGFFPQGPNAPVCEGSGEKPWDHTPPEGGYKVETTTHGGARLVGTEEPEEDTGPSLEDYAMASRIIQSLIPGVRR
jgi:hypothetical protein